MNYADIKCLSIGEDDVYAAFNWFYNILPQIRSKKVKDFDFILSVRYFRIPVIFIPNAFLQMY